ncbi:hypothetical protein [uncultured Sanguibacteroides sp.]|uniref:golvesin C-terminal-like domain-containing protein n=1 Tax=uncultured Sanguibacteroides sp. TaxID=1635151 RepID=UPI0025F5430A|nr:hypothetical protein [uncultured Sanguibacteroides sp.]
MTFPNINTVARYEAKILKRSWLFRVLAIVSLVGVIAFQIMIQGKLTFWTSWNLIAMSSYIPYMNLYLFGMAMAVAVIFLGGELLNRDRKLDTMEIIYARSMSNADYVIGKSWGIVRVFMGLALISLLLGGIVNLFLSDAPFNGFIYLFYWIVFLLPSLVFILGLTFWISSIVRNKALTILLLLGYVFLTIFYLSERGQGLCDFLGSTIPNTFSDLTGYPNPGSVLLQRLVWLFLGMGFIGYSVTLLRRIPNRPGRRIVQHGFSTLFVFVGVICGCVLYFSNDRERDIRSAYRASYDRYNSSDKLTLDRETIAYCQKGDQIEVRAFMKLVNCHDREVNSVILYLNPGLNVKRLTKESQELSFLRDNQVIEIKEKVAPGDSLLLILEYAGQIDESVCYLDVDDKYIFDTRTTGSSIFRSGKRYAFVGKDYSLLTPECLWYPVSVPPVNLKNVYDIQKNFTDYRLNVVGMGDKTVLSQGLREASGDTLIFQDEHRLPGISLCIGSYKKYAITADSVSFELYITEGHDDFMSCFTEIQDSMVSVLADLKYKTEEKMNRKYPYSRFIVVESPSSFASYYRNERGGSERIQPEMAFLPERGVGFWGMNFKKTLEGYAWMQKVNKTMGSVLNGERQAFKQFVQSVFMSEYGSSTEGNPLKRRFMLNNTMFDYALNGNQYDISPLFSNYVTYIYSSEYPIMNIILNGLLKRGKAQGMLYSTYSTSYKKAMNYLKDHSIKDALENPGITSDVLYQVVNLKALILQLQYFGLTIDQKEFNDFIERYFDEHKYKQVEFACFNEDFIEYFGIDWLKVLPEWYTVNRVPSYIIRDCFIEAVEGDTKEPDYSKRRYRIHASIYNDSDVDGVVSLNYSLLPKMEAGTAVMAYTNDEMYNRNQNVLVEAGKAKEIMILCKGQLAQVSLNTNISGNLPSIITLSPYGSGRETRDTSSGIKDIDTSRFFPKEGELIVDNESNSFRVLNAPSGNQLRKWFKTNDTTKYKDFYKATFAEEWALSVHDGFYGGHVRSGWRKEGGNGSSKVEWSIWIEKAGYYEVFAYLPSMVSLFQMKVSNNMVIGVQKQTPIKQFYLVRHDGNESEVELEVPLTQREWLSLGRFYYPVGEASVVLTDKESIPNQIIYADAIKWVYDGEK